MFCGTNRISWNIPHISTTCGNVSNIFYKILAVRQITVVDLNNVMNLTICGTCRFGRDVCYGYAYNYYYPINVRRHGTIAFVK